jgi:hypothetical protein
MTLIDSINLWRLQNQNEFYFNDIVLDERLNKEDLYNMILTEYMNMLVLYANPQLFKTTVKLFFLKNKDRISDLIDTTVLNYDPLENYSTVETGKLDRTGTKGFTQADNRTENITREGDTTSTHYVSAFNNVQGEDVEQSRDVIEAKEKVVDTENYASAQDTNTKDNEETRDTKKGITNLTYQDLVEKQRKVVQFSIYEWILKEFAKDLLVAIW